MFKTVAEMEERLVAAVDLGSNSFHMNEKKITSLLVVSDKDSKRKNKKLKGLIHIHTLLQNGIK